jgi:enoyl-CoA hydratase/carnithine racemase
MPAELQTERRDSALVLTISDPGSTPLLSEQVFTAGVESLGVAESDPEVRCILLRGEGAHFCADANLPLWTDPAAAADMRRHFQDFAEALRVFPKPVIAVVEGMACGDGFWLAMSCDLLVAASDARFLPFPTRLGLEHGEGGAFPGDPARRVPRSQWLEWMWLAEPLSAERLQRLGYVNRLADSGQALNQALAWARLLAQRPPEALAQAKECVNRMALAR